MMIEALPAWQSHFSIAAIGNLYVAPKVRKQGMGCGILEQNARLD